jgi:hypothetical protein
LTYYSAYAILVDDEEDDHESNSWIWLRRSFW